MAKARIEPGSSALKEDTLTTRPTRQSGGSGEEGGGRRSMGRGMDGMDEGRRGRSRLMALSLERVSSRANDTFDIVVDHCKVKISSNFTFSDSYAYMCISYTMNMFVYVFPTQ